MGHHVCIPCRIMPVVETQASGDLMEQLDQMNSAEPLDAESDLIIRMSAVSKVRGGSKKEKKKKKSLSPTKSISKKQSRRSKCATRNVAQAAGGNMET